MKFEGLAPSLVTISERFHWRTLLSIKQSTMSEATQMSLKSSSLLKKKRYRILHGRKYKPINVCYDPLQAGSIDGTDTEPHDNGIVRALNAKYCPKKSNDGNPFATLFVGRLDQNITEEYLTKKFSRFGEIVKCKLVRDLVTGFSKCFAFVEFKTEEDAYTAFIEGRNFLFEGKKIIIDFERERTLPGWVPRRLGGGFGGRKESGQLRFGGRYCHLMAPIHVSKDRFKSHSSTDHR